MQRRAAAIYDSNSSKQLKGSMKKVEYAIQLQSIVTGSWHQVGGTWPTIGAARREIKKTRNCQYHQRLVRIEGGAMNLIEFKECARRLAEKREAMDWKTRAETAEAELNATLDTLEECGMALAAQKARAEKFQADVELMAGSSKAWELKYDLAIAGRDRLQADNDRLREALMFIADPRSRGSRASVAALALSASEGKGEK